MKTPDDIKKWLALCVDNEAGCTGCPYDDVEACHGDLMEDAYALIQQLERERNAAVEELKQSLSCCCYCKHNRPYHRCAKEAKVDRSCFEWHGVEEEKTNED